MLARALDASAISVVATISPARYAAPVSDEPVVTAWRAIAASHAAASAALERELGQLHGLGVSEFEVHDRLAERGERDFRAQELAEAVHLSQSALSRLVDRLRADGRGRHAEAAPTHRDVLASVLPAGLLAP